MAYMPQTVGMIRTQVYLTEEQAQDIKLRAKREKKAEAENILGLLETGGHVASSTDHESTGDTLLRLATLGDKLHVKAPVDLSSKIDHDLYGDE